MIAEREKESQQLLLLIKRIQETHKSETVYVNGVPGSGKTYIINKILEKEVQNHVSINCAKLRNKYKIFERISKKMECFDCTDFSIKKLRAHFSVCKKLHCIFLDEFDMLLTKKNNILYNIFDLTQIEESKILLIVAANTMDIPEKMMDAKIRSRMGDNRINFAPYNHIQLKNIMKPGKRFKSDAVELLTRKIGAVTGDCRKLLRIVRIAKKNKKGEITVKDVNKVMDEQSNPIYVRFLQNLCVEQKLIVYLLKNQIDVEINCLFAKMVVFYKRNNEKEVEYFDFLNCIESLILFGIVLKINRNGVCWVKSSLLPEEIEDALKKDPKYKKFCLS